MASRTSWAVCTSFTAVVACADAPASQSVYDSMDCAACPIVLEPIATLGARSDTIWPARTASVARDGHGRFYVGVTDHPGVMAIYSADGRMLRTFGRRGQGPGEYDTPYARMVRSPGDTMSVIDLADGRRTVIDSMGRPLRTERLPHEFFGIAWLEDGRRVAAAHMMTPQLVGKPLHLLADDGSIVRSFGEFGRYTSYIHGYRSIAAARDGGLWVAFPNRYRIEHYDSTLQLSQVIEFEPEWFEPWDIMSGPDEPPSPMMTGIWEDMDGRVWVTIRTADLLWHERDPASRAPERRPVVANTHAKNDYLLEVIDPSRGTRIASQRFDQGVSRNVGDGLVHSRSQRSVDGGISLTVFQPHLRRERIEK